MSPSAAYDLWRHGWCWLPADEDPPGAPGPNTAPFRLVQDPGVYDTPAIVTSPSPLVVPTPDDDEEDAFFVLDVPWLSVIVHNWIPRGPLDCSVPPLCPAGRRRAESHPTSTPTLHHV